MSDILVLQTYLHIFRSVGWLLHTIASLQRFYKRLVNIHARIRNSTCHNHSVFIQHSNLHKHMVDRQSGVLRCY